MPVGRLPVAFAVNVDRMAVRIGPSDRLRLSTALMQKPLGVLFFHRVMDPRIPALRTINFDDINLCHTYLPFASTQLDGVTLDPEFEMLKLFPARLGVSERWRRGWCHPRGHEVSLRERAGALRLGVEFQ
jgi:hypothetical protein